MAKMEGGVKILLDIDRVLTSDEIPILSKRCKSSAIGFFGLHGETLRLSLNFSTFRQFDRLPAS
jgi:hypothetical protein